MRWRTSIKKSEPTFLAYTFLARTIYLQCIQGLRIKIKVLNCTKSSQKHSLSCSKTHLFRKFVMPRGHEKLPCVYAGIGLWDGAQSKHIIYQSHRLQWEFWTKRTLRIQALQLPGFYLYLERHILVYNDCWQFYHEAWLTFNLKYLVEHREHQVCKEIGKPSRDNSQNS